MFFYYLSIITTSHKFYSNSIWKMGGDQNSQNALNYSLQDHTPFCTYQVKFPTKFV